MNPEEFLRQHREKHDEFYKEFTSYENVFRHNDNIAFCNEGAKEYAQLGIKNLLWINGGALVALPAIIEAFGLEVNQSIIFAAWFYAAGLVAIIVCILLAYFSMTQAMLSVASDRNNNYSSLLGTNMIGVYEEETLIALKKDAETARDETEKHGFWATVWEIGAIVFGIVSLSCFITGSLLFLNSLSL